MFVLQILGKHKITNNIYFPDRVKIIFEILNLIIFVLSHWTMKCSLIEVYVRLDLNQRDSILLYLPKNRIR
jgi:hypothetical protein